MPRFGKFNMASVRVVGLLMLAGLITACGGAQVQMQSSYPPPLVQPVPVHVGLLTDDAFANYQHTESIEGFGDWSVLVGSDQQHMFEQTMRGLFARFSQVSGIGQTAMGAELIIKPEVDTFEISIPGQSQTEFFEVRIVYQIQLLETQGQEVVNWTLSAYGRSDVRNFRSLTGSNSGAALAAATRTALRDASALIARQLPLLPEMKTWLAERARRGESSAGEVSGEATGE